MMLLYIIVVLQLLSLTGASESGIEGGHESEAHSKPYMASLQVNGRHVCGGILIREDFVLTAAHCKKDTEVIMVVLGAHDLNNPDEKKIQQKIPVAEYRYHKHPSYCCNNTHDIMLLKLKTNAKPNKIVKTIGLAEKDEDEIPARTECSVIGWGQERPGTPNSEVLKEAKVKIEFSDECYNKWKGNFTRNQMICTHANKSKTAKTNVGIWQGDSGGPLICRGKVYGISAFVDVTYEWNTAEYRPNVFMKVSFFSHWIETVMKW